MTPSPRRASEVRLAELDGPRHAVRFYEDDELLCEAVARYVGAGAAAGERVVVIATEAHWTSIAGRLTDRAFDLERATATGRLEFLEARETLARLLVDGMPDAALFEQVIGRLIAPHGHVRAYDEMVDLLWRDGNLPAALRLEEHWNRLAEEHSMSLLCAYVVTRFDRDCRPGELDDVCRAHTHAIAESHPADADDLHTRMRDIGLLQQRARALEDEIGRRKQLETALREALEARERMAIDNARAYREAQEANRVKDDFLATMSHELRTPLNAILGWSAMLRARPDVDVKKAVETIERNARAQVRLIEEILDISRIMTGKLKLDLKPIDLAAVLRASVDVVSPSALAKGITLETHVEVEPCPFHGDAGRLQQVFWNLLSNAVKFTPKGGCVEARLARAGSEVELTVKDTGRGIRSDFLPVMFQRFRQADSSTTRTEGGLGIGLAIVGHLVELHGGVVKAHSGGEGQGATVVVRLPVRAVSLQYHRPASPTTTDAKLLSGLRVLVCEDDIDCRELLQEVLSNEGATVRVAAAAAEALDHLREFRPDVLVSDIGLPLVDGYALIRQIRQLGEQQGGRTPAIALTAYAGGEDARRAFSAGYQLHVTKPVDPDELATRVANLAGRSGRSVGGTR
jgi:signal transduction histidine kinase/ActR/RegA family two-component response regulator